MSYPYDPSNFRSNAPFATFFFIGDELFQTDGFSLLNTVISTIFAALPTNPMRDPAGTPITDADSRASSDSLAWDASFLRVVYAAAQAFRLPQSDLDVITADIANGSVSVRTTQIAIWISEIAPREVRVNGRLVQQYGAGSPDEVRIPENTVLPQFGLPLTAGTYFGPPARLLVPRATQPPALQPTTRVGTGSPLVALAFVGAVAVAGIFLISNVRTVEQKRRRNPTKKSKRSRAYA